MIKVRVGQFWSIGDSDFKISHANGGNDGTCVSVGYGWININEFYDKFNFTPQNNLEMLAVKLDKWHFSQEFAYWNGDAVFCSTIVNPGPHNAHNESQWQNMRYYLGLDKKPHYEFINGQWSETK